MRNHAYVTPTIAGRRSHAYVTAAVKIERGAEKRVGGYGALSSCRNENTNVIIVLPVRTRVCNCETFVVPKVTSQLVFPGQQVENSARAFRASFHSSSGTEQSRAQMRFAGDVAHGACASAIEKRVARGKVHGAVALFFFRRFDTSLTSISAATGCGRRRREEKATGKFSRGIGGGDCATRNARARA